MKSVLFFTGFTATALLYCIFPSRAMVWLSATIVTMISVCLIIIRFDPRNPMYFRRYTSGKPYPYADMTGTVYFMFFADVFALFGEALAFFAEVMIEPIPPESFIWIVYAITLILNYVVPAAIYLYWRIGFYLDVREKVENHSWEMSANIREFIFYGRRNVHNITIETQSGTLTVGILGDINAMVYAIEDGTIKAKRTTQLDKEYTMIDYGGEEKKELPRCYRIKGCGSPLPGHIGRTYLMIQPNVFVSSNNFLVDIGEEVEGMRLLNMETGMKVVHE